MKKTFMKMQSLSRKALLCGGLIAMAAAITGCSSDAPDPGENPTPGVVQTDGDPLTVISDQATLSGLVLNYASNDNSDAPKAYKLPEVPSSEGAVDATSDDFKSKLNGPGGSVALFQDKGIKIPKGKYTGDLDINTSADKPINIFIEGTYEGELTGSCHANVYILEGGRWNIKGTNSLSRNGDLKIYDYNSETGLVFPDGLNTAHCSYYGKNFYSSKNFKFDKNGSIFVEGAISVGTLNLCENAIMSAKCLIADDVNITNFAKCYIGAYMEAKNLYVDSNGCAYLNEDAYVKVDNLDCHSGNCGFNSPDGKAIIYANVYYTTASLGYTWNGDKQWNDLNESGKFRGTIDVYVGEVYSGNSKENRKGEKYNADQLQTGSENVKFYSNGDKEFDNFNEDWMTECPSGSGNGGNGGGGDNPDPVKPNPGPTPFPKNPEVIIEIGDADHKHPISATGIDVSGNNVYVSWHERGGSIKGCIEAIAIEGDKATVNSWMQTERWEYAPGDPNGDNASIAYDFNHVIYDPAANALITVGEHAKKGGFIGRIKLGKTFGENAVVNVLENRQLGVEKYSGNDLQALVAGGSGNSVVISPDGKYLLVASRGGYLSIPYTGSGYPDPFVKGEDGKNLVTSKDIKARATEGSGKHIALFDGKVVSIEYTESSDKADWWEDNTTALDAKISLWDTWENFPEGEPKTTTNVQAFSPVFGKDVIAMDASGIYSCQGHNGVAKYDATLNEVARFKVSDYAKEHSFMFTNKEYQRLSKPESESAAANGLAVDNNYVYVAYGAAGLWVLKKDSLEPVGFYNSAVRTYPANDKENPKASANYVKVMDDGKIVVAYGRDGVKVFKLPK